VLCFLCHFNVEWHMNQHRTSWYHKWNYHFCLVTLLVQFMRLVLKLVTQASDEWEERRSWIELKMASHTLCYTIFLQSIWGQFQHLPHIMHFLQPQGSSWCLTSKHISFSLGFACDPSFMLVSCLAYSSALKIEATCTSKLSVAQWFSKFFFVYFL
jgi:hypothetical protein